VVIAGSRACSGGDSGMDGRWKTKEKNERGKKTEKKTKKKQNLSSALLFVAVVVGRGHCQHLHLPCEQWLTGGVALVSCDCGGYVGGRHVGHALSLASLPGWWDWWARTSSQPQHLPFEGGGVVSDVATSVRRDTYLVSPLLLVPSRRLLIQRRRCRSCVTVVMSPSST
jgi:hypothetical protein